MSARKRIEWIDVETVRGTSPHDAAKITRIILPHLRPVIDDLTIDAYFDCEPPHELRGFVDALLTLGIQQRSSRIAKILLDPRGGVRLDPKNDEHFQLFSNLAAYSILATAWGPGPKGRPIEIFESNDTSDPVSLVVTDQQWAEISADLTSDQLGMLLVNPKGH